MFASSNIFPVVAVLIGRNVSANYLAHRTSLARGSTISHPHHSGASDGSISEAHC